MALAALCPQIGDINSNSKCEVRYQEGQDYKIIFNAMRVRFILAIPPRRHEISGGLVKKPRDC